MVLLLSIKTDKDLIVEELQAFINYKMGISQCNAKLKKTKVKEVSVEGWRS